MGSNKKSALNTIVGKGSILEGTFEVQDGIRVDGTLRGQLVTSGTLVVGPSGILEADPIRVKDAYIAGKLTGKIEATNQVRLESSAVFVGDITARGLIIEEGATIRGFCESGESMAMEARDVREVRRGGKGSETERGEAKLEVKKAVG